MGDSTVVLPPGDAGERPGDQIGPYKLLQKLGEGGFGAVFDAEQATPVRRRVAIKIIKLGMDTREVIARFEAERQALALMDHPHIARVFDAGSTGSGRPYFVMELVQGEPISEYADRHKLSVAQRLELFEQVCAAVQHAHTKGIIHRDLKPNNILVSTHDDRPFARIIDFGIAKATSGRLTDRTLFTEIHQVMGTPLYMSPEQAEGSPDIDTRTDIYSLGVVLYELLTGSTPVESHSLNSAGLAEMQRLICQVEPPIPSSRVAKKSARQTDVASKRQLEPRRLTGLIRGELDWIVMKALEKNRARRYETANGFAMDVRRYLAGQPVQAAPPGAGYRIGKFVRRNRGAVIGVSLIATSLIVGAVGFAWQAREARAQEHIAKTRAAELEKVSAFQAEMLSQVDPLKAGRQLTKDVREKFEAGLEAAQVAPSARADLLAGFDQGWRYVNATDAARDVIDKTVLEPAVSAIDREFGDQPLVASTLRLALAQRYQSLGFPEKSLPLDKQAQATRSRVLGSKDPLALEAEMAVGTDLMLLQRQAEAEAYARRVVAGRRAVFGPDNAQTVEAIAFLGRALDEQGKYVEAEPFYRETLAWRRKHLGNDNPSTIEAISDMGYLADDLGKAQESESLYREAIERGSRILGLENQTTLAAVGNLGSLLLKQRKFALAEPYLRQSYELSRKALGEENPDTLVSMAVFGRVLVESSRLAEAEPILASALEKRQRVFGHDHPSSIKSLDSWCDLMMREKKALEAERCSEELLSTRQRVFGADSFDAAVSEWNLGRAKMMNGDKRAALNLFSGAEGRIRKSGEGLRDYLLSSFLLDLGNARLQLGDYALAQQALTESASLFEKLGNRDDPKAAKCRRLLALLRVAWPEGNAGKVTPVH